MKIDAYAFNMALLTYDADMFITNKMYQTLVLQPQGMGDNPNHYDLLHQIEEHRTRGNIFIPRTEESKRAHKAHIKEVITISQTQTSLTQNIDNNESMKPFIGPIHRSSYAKKMDFFKDNCWTDDLETRKKHMEKGYNKKGRLYQEKE